MKYLRTICVLILAAVAGSSLYIAATRPYVEPHFMDVAVSGALLRVLGGGGYYNEGFVVLAVAALFAAFCMTWIDAEYSGR